MTLTSNRTYWPTTGGAIAFQPGWFQGHQTAFLYVNLGIGSDGPDGGPANMSLPMVSPFQILGPSKNPYPGTVCLPQVPLPANLTVKAGDNATIQIVEIAVHGASLFSVRLRNILDRIMTLANMLYSVSILHLSSPTPPCWATSTRPTALTAPTLGSLKYTPLPRKQLAALQMLRVTPWPP